MRGRWKLGSALTALALLAGFAGEAPAQVVEAREGSANPAEVLFRSTLFGAGTGLALGGAYVLVDDDADVGQTLRWSTAGGAAGGLLIGLVYMVTRSGADEGDAGAVVLDEDGVRFSVVGALPEKRRDMAGVRGRAYDVSVLSLGL